jgi:predicted dehydrogenase
VHINWGPEGWFKQKKLAGGGALVDMGVHALDTARYIMDDPQPMSVYARIGAYYIRGDVDDTAVMMVNWDNDAVSYIEAGWWQPHMDGPESATQVYGRKGFGSVFPTKMEIPNKVNHEVDILDPGYTYPRAEHFPQKMYDRQIFAFIRAIETHKNPKPGGMDGLMNMKVLDAAYQSAKTGKSVEIKI